MPSLFGLMVALQVYCSVVRARDAACQEFIHTLSKSATTLRLLKTPIIFNENIPVHYDIHLL